MGTRDESSVPSTALLIGSSRNSLKSAAGSGDSSRALKSEMFYRNATDIIGPCFCSCQENPDSAVRETPTQYNAPTLTVGDDNFEFDGYLKQLYFRFDKLCRACGDTKLVSDFYTIKDYSSLGMTSYPAARCKPCHNSRTAENQRVRRRAQKLLKIEVGEKSVPPYLQVGGGPRSSRARPLLV